MNNVLSTNSHPLLGWVFRKGQEVLSCNLVRRAQGDFAVLVVPHSRASLSSFERHDRAVDAFERHATVARELREMGWMLVGYQTPRHPEPRERVSAAAA